MSNQHNQPECGRELTLKETSTASLLSRLEETHSELTKIRNKNRRPSYVLLAEVEAIEQELEERNEWESKVSRW